MTSIHPCPSALPYLYAAAAVQPLRTLVRLLLPMKPAVRPVGPHLNTLSTLVITKHRHTSHIRAQTSFHPIPNCWVLGSLVSKNHFQSEN